MARPKSIKYPVSEIAARLMQISAFVQEPACTCERECECEWCDVRLTLYENGYWDVTYGLADYDSHMSHSADQLSTREPLTLKDAQRMARELINQAADFVAEDDTWERPVAYAMTRAERERMRGAHISSAYDLT